MGGHLEMNSEVNVGTTVKFNIPFEKVKEEKQIGVYENSPDGFSQKREKTLSECSDISILVVDDDELNISILKHYLHQINPNWNPKSCNDGDVAVEIFKKNGPFAVVFMDTVS